MQAENNIKKEVKELKKELRVYKGKLNDDTRRFDEVDAQLTKAKNSEHVKSDPS